MLQELFDKYKSGEITLSEYNKQSKVVIEENNRKKKNVFHSSVPKKYGTYGKIEG